MCVQGKGEMLGGESGGHQDWIMAGDVVTMAMFDGGVEMNLWTKENAEQGELMNG